MDVDREAFLALVFAMAGCGAQPTPEPVVVVTAPPPPDAGAITIAPPPATSEPETPKVSEATACQKENDEGEIDCTSMTKLKGPACEGAEGICGLLEKGVGFRKKSAAAAARCLARIGRNACNIQMRKKCYAEGLAAACPEPEFEAFCEQRMSECKARHLTPSYTKEGCMRAMSGQKGGPDRDWAMSQMGPSSEGKCELLFSVF